ncbi:MAG: hypothetical protein HYZ37_07655 [Candidatus Solibacter usitatus]|nr:hypothetical protein [Candidatus Solibacter usitatus]
MSVHASRAILAGVLTCVYTPQLFAQEKPERAGQAEIALQGYYIGGSQQPILDTSGVAIKLQSFFPKLGLLQVNLEGYSGQNRFRPGDNYVDLSNLIWKSTRWNLSGGDFRIPTTLTTFHFNNIIYPEISVRGGRVTARRGRQKYTVFYGLETLQAGPRIPFRVSPGQNVLGASFQYAASEKLEFGVQFLNLTNGQSTNQYAATLKLPGREFRAANIASAQISYKPLKKVTFFAEVNTSSVQRPAATEPDASFEVPVSRKQDWTREAAAVAGVQWDTERVTVRANYVRQGAFYMPIAGFFLGDRQGPYAELRYRLFSRLELYASTSRYENNLARRADLPTYHSRSETAGANLRLPARFSASGSLTLLKFRSQGQEVFQNSNTKNQLWTATLSKSIYKHNLRLTYREIKLSLISGSQKQVSKEVEDTFQWGPFVMGGAVRLDTTRTDQMHNTLFGRGSVQVRMKRVTAYGFMETGRDLLNESVFATNSLNSTTLGATVRIGHGWNLLGEAFRSSLTSQLNPAHIFLLQGQGVEVPSTLGGLNQWSFFVRMTKDIRWGKGLERSTIDQFAAESKPRNRVCGGVCLRHR